LAAINKPKKSNTRNFLAVEAITEVSTSYVFFFAIKHVGEGGEPEDKVQCPIVDWKKGGSFPPS
jgi:hypothetical protein